MGEREHRQNRVTPFASFEAVAERGMFMGNRGNLRRADGTQKVWDSRGWVCCVTLFRGRRLDLGAPNRYTPLFFSDEAVAFAAGHRPAANVGMQTIRCSSRHGGAHSASRAIRHLPPATWTSPFIRPVSAGAGN